MKKENEMTDPVQQIDRIDYLHHLATKADVMQVKVDLVQVENSLQKEIHRVESKLEKQIQEVESNLQKEIHRVENKLEKQIHELRTELKEDIHRLELAINGLTSRGVWAVLVIIVAPFVIQILGKKFGLS